MSCGLLCSSGDWTVTFSVAAFLVIRANQLLECLEAVSVTCQTCRLQAACGESAYGFPGRAQDIRRALSRLFVT
ncbi:hypothetical protein BX600DRAFT_233780 [Xylariales sp. PMI_506]|nr:hypothetical protein BX600DRAFT_233780 [Xylariales sp. PMI_506]